MVALRAARVDMCGGGGYENKGPYCKQSLCSATLIKDRQEQSLEPVDVRQQAPE